MAEAGRPDELARAVKPSCSNGFASKEVEKRAIGARWSPAGLMGFPPPRVPMVNPDRPWPRPETPRAPLDATTSETLELWCAQPEFDTRSLEEFAAEGGRPMVPPNRLEPEPGFLQWLARPEGGWLEFFRWLFRWTSSREPLYVVEGLDQRGRKIPPRPTILPPCPPSKNFETGHLRSSLTPNEIRALNAGEPVDLGGCLIFPFPQNIRPTLGMTPPPPDSGETFKR